MLAMVLAVFSSATAWAQEDCQAKYEQLKRDYEAVSADRDNIVLQVRKLVEANEKCQSSEAQINKAVAEKEAAQKDARAAKEQW